jgi:hypothetical protein
MTRHFSIPKMLRMTPNSLLREFFDRLGHQPPGLDWLRLKERQFEPILTAMGGLPLEAQAQIESTLSAVFELSCETGVQTLLEVARKSGNPAVVAALTAGGCPHQHAMWAWLRHPDLFEQASLLQQIDSLTRWRKRKGLPQVEPRTTPDALDGLAGALSQFLRHEEGRGQQCTVEHFRRADDTDYFVAYPDDFVHLVDMHDEQGRLVSRRSCQTFEIVFGYHRQEGALDLFAKVTSEMKPKLECLFGHFILGQDIGPRRPDVVYNLDRLKDRYFALDTDPDDHLSASLCRLRLTVPGRARLTVEPLRDDGQRDLYQVIDDILKTEEVSWNQVQISKATIRFNFQSGGLRSSPPLTCEVTHPDCCRVNSRRPERIDLTRKYLKRWRIANA